MFMHLQPRGGFRAISVIVHQRSGVFKDTVCENCPDLVEV